MARTTLTVNDGTPNGSTVTGNLEAGTADGHQFANTDSNVVIMAVNTSGAATRTVNIPVPKTLTDSDLAVASATNTIPISSTVLMGPYNQKYFQQDDGYVYIDFADGGSESDVEIYVYKLPKNLK